MGRRQRWYVVLIVILVLLYALRFADLPLPDSLPLAGRVSARRVALLQAQAELDGARKLVALQREKLAQTAGMAAHYYPATTTSTDIQTVVENLARETNLTFSSLRSITASGEKHDLLRAEEVNLTGTVDIKALAQFMRAVENHRPVLLWASLNLAPRNQGKQVNQVFISGRLRAPVLTTTAGAILAGEPTP
jgi:hypothetical protein